MTEPIKPPRRHRVYFWVNERLMTWLLKMDPRIVPQYDDRGNVINRYICAACIREDHDHCESVNDRPSFCECCAGSYHGHPHDPEEYWPHPAATKPEARDVRLAALQWREEWDSVLDGLGMTPRRGTLPMSPPEAEPNEVDPNA